MTTPSPETIAFSKLSTGIHCLEQQVGSGKSASRGWETTSLTENGTKIFGLSANKLIENQDLWSDRIHPNDIDSVIATFQGTDESIEKNVFYRFRDSKERYRWIGYRFTKSGPHSIVGFVSDATQSRADEYFSRLHIAGRSGLANLLESSDISATINSFLKTLGSAMVVDRARLVRIRQDGQSFITHEWVRENGTKKIELPTQLQDDLIRWWLEKLENDGGVTVENSDRADLPPAVASTFAESSTKAVLAVPAVINGVIEAFACFEVTSGVRNWLPNEILEATIVLNGYARSVERRIEDRKQAAEEFKLRSSEERYRLITSHSPVVLFGIDADGIFTLSEGLGLGSMGANPGEVVGLSMYELYRNYPEVLEHANRALAGEESHGRVKIGEQVFETWFTPVKDDDGIVVGVSGVSVDITRRHELEKQQLIMMRELDHRVKNNIASVMSLVELSKQGSNSVDEYASTLDGRLHALAVAHSTLSKTHWSGAWLRDILLLTLQPYMVGDRTKIYFKGPDVELPGILARPMCMSIHELATNAMKHGALKADSGIVLVTTKLLGNDQAQLTWLETDGPPITDEQIPSTGTSLLEGLVSHEMNGSIDMDFKKSGLNCVITFPLTQS
ncbi:MAG: HWE histidine kinase domain-containing protein [Phycisphaerales bacterium]|nr:HWE histidine kinase domain-containing protein [Phycisphaerales bacterium]